MFAANQDSGCVAMLAIDADEGTLSPIDTIALGSPCALAFVSDE
jgi:6-phosphogluconolactonase (cycloisomerase 2 family)